MDRHILLSDLIRAYALLGRFPHKTEYKSLGLKSCNTYRRRGIMVSDVTLKEFIYNNHPVECELCGDVIPYSKRFNNFCSHRCAAIYNNPKRKNRKQCLQCDNEVNSRSATYCSRECHKSHQADKLYQLFIEGFVDNLGHTSLKNCVIRRDGDECSACGIKDWNNTPLVFDLDHIDGDSYNNSPDNLRLLCPNCHSQTPTYKGRNSGKGRHSRRERYKKGLSY